MSVPSSKSRPELVKIQNPTAYAFSLKADVYDQFAQNHPLLARMRNKVRQKVLSLLSAEDKILEINAGTGEDAVFFAKRGYRVHATDIAPGMLNTMKRKVIEHGLGDRLTVQALSFMELSRVDGKDFQLLFSNMGGINCTDDLEAITQQIPSVLSPGGYVVWVIMPPICIWELVNVFRGNLKFALRRMATKGVLANIEGISVRTFYHPVSRVENAFGSHFELIDVSGLSVFTPPADHKFFVFNHPRVNHILCRLDDLLSDRFPFNRVGDFYIITLRYQP